MISTNPLSDFPLVETESVEMAELALSRSLARCHIRSDSKRFHVSLNGVRFGRTSLSYNHYGADALVDSEDTGDSVFFVVGQGRASEFRYSGRKCCSHPENPLLVSQTNHMQIARPGGSGILVVRASMPDLENHLQILTEYTYRGGLEFDHEADLIRGAGGTLMRLMRLMRYMAGELMENPSCANHPLFRRSYDESLMNSLLSLPNSAQGLIAPEKKAQQSPRVVTMAQEYMRENLRESVTVTDLLKLCGCSRGTLFSSFRSACGYSPMEFLAEQRLHEARRILQGPLPESSVSTVALDCGFSHLGRFANSYRKRFGEAPSVTLKRAKGC